VARGQCLGVDASGAALLGVAPRAAGIGEQLGLVDRVTVEAAARTRVLRGLLFLVAGEAGFGLQRRGLVRAMAGATRLIRVSADSCV
jgi:hypothetical protein